MNNFKCGNKKKKKFNIIQYMVNINTLKKKSKINYLFNVSI